MAPGAHVTQPVSPAFDLLEAFQVQTALEERIARLPMGEARTRCEEALARLTGELYPTDPYAGWAPGELTEAFGR